MRWKGRQGSSNVEDRRGARGAMSGRGMKVGGGLGIIGVAVVIIVTLMGGDPSEVMQNIPGGGSNVRDNTTAPAGTQSTGNAKEDEQAQFVSVVLKDCEDVWNKVFKDQVRGASYREPILVLFNGQVQSACGFASAATGPFYCPGDQKLYIDLSFYDELKTKFGAPGDFAMAYVVAHEVGHHVQYLLGTTREVQSEQRRSSKAEANQLSVRLELQADFYAGLWAHHAQKMKNILENGDIEEALNAARAIGDDRLQKNANGYVVPESFTHGTSAQRMKWYKAGFQSGLMRDGDTFGARNL
jgi:predicted metalloprotease